MAFLNNSSDTKAFQVLKEWLKSQGNPAFDKIENTFENSMPHRVFHFEITDIINKENIEKANFVAWRFLFKDSNNYIQAFEMAEDHTDNSYILQEVNYGPNVDEEKQLIDSLMVQDYLNGYEYVLLRIAELKIKAGWLRSPGNDRSKDFFCPLSPAFYEMEPFKVLPSNDFMLKIVNTATTLIQMLPDSADYEMIGD